MFTSGLLELYQAELDPSILEVAIELHGELFEFFADDDGALFNTRPGQSDLLVRTKTAYDGSTPTANSVAAANALTLFELSGRQIYADQCEAILRSFHSTLEKSPLALSHLLLTLDAWFGERVELVVSGGDLEEARSWVQRARRGYRPDLAISWLPSGAASAELIQLLPSLEGKESPGETTAYVCRAFACRQPTTDLEEMAFQLELQRQP